MTPPLDAPAMNAPLDLPPHDGAVVRQPGKGGIGRRLARGGLWSLAGLLLQGGGSLVIGALIARLLAPKDVGAYFLAYSFVTTGSLVLMLGMNRSVVRLVAVTQGAGRAITQRVLMIFGASALLCGALATAFGLTGLADTTLPRGLANALAALTVWLLTFSLRALLAEIFRGGHDLKTATILSRVLHTAATIVLLLAMLAGGHHWSIGEVMTASALASLAAAAFGLFKMARRPADDAASASSIRIGEILTRSLPLMAAGVALQLVRDAHVFVLSARGTPDAVALFGAAMRTISVVNLPLLLLNAVIPPTVAQLWASKDLDRLRALMTGSAAISSIPAIVVSALLLAFGGVVLGLLYGDFYRGAGPVLAIMVVGQLTNVLTGSCGILLTMSGHERVMLTTTLTATVIGIAASFLLIPALGAVGAAIGFSIGIVLNEGLKWQVCRRKLGIDTRFFLRGSLTHLKHLRRTLKGAVS